MRFHIFHNIHKTIEGKENVDQSEYAIYVIARRAHAEISQNGSYSHHREVVISVSLHGQQWPFEGAGTRSK